MLAILLLVKPRIMIVSIPVVITTWHFDAELLDVVVGWYVPPLLTGGVTLLLFPLLVCAVVRLRTSMVPSDATMTTSTSSITSIAIILAMMLSFTLLMGPKPG